MVHRLVVVAAFMLGCSDPGPGDHAGPVTPAQAAAGPATPETAKPEMSKPEMSSPAGEAEPARVEPAPVDPEPAADGEESGLAAGAQPRKPAPVYVMLGGAGSSTTKPVANAVLGHQWGWATATKETIRECERQNTDDIGKSMWCSTEDKPRGSAKLISGLKLKLGTSTFVEPADVAGWNVAPPSSPVWLIGPDRVCAATVGRPLVGYYSIDADGRRLRFTDHFTILELAWELTGCDAASGAWAPIGVSAASFDETQRWVTVKAGPRERFDPNTWTGALASAITKLPDDATTHLREQGYPVSGAGEWWMQAFELPGSTLRELHVSAVWRGPNSPKDPDKYGCGDREFNEVFQYRDHPRKPTSLGRGSRGRLVGGLVDGAGKAQSLVWTDSRDLAFAQVKAWRLGPSIALSTGQSHPEDGDATGYSLLPYCGP